MTDENKPVIEPEDDATVVHDQPTEEEANDQLVSNVAKMLGRDEHGETTVEETPDKAPPDEKAPPKGEDEPALDDYLLSRAEGAGISKELAQRLHQMGNLEETLAAFDRKMIERFRSKETEDKKEPEAKGRETPPPEEPEAKDAPDLDPDIYGEELVKRDAYYHQRIDVLEAQLAELLDRRQVAFDARFDSMIDGLGYDDVFGKGAAVTEDQQVNRDKLFQDYKDACQTFGADPDECDPLWGLRAFGIAFPEVAFKKDDDIRKEGEKEGQRQTVALIRDAEGKFLPSSKSRGAPPPKGATDEEIHSELVSNVASYLKKRGVQMSGV